MVAPNKKLILYELNEVPLKLLKLYSEIRPHSNISYLINQGNILKTTTNDIGELHPWSTWPTVHRGVSNEKHKINFINQDLTIAKKWPPIWEKLAKTKVSIGIFGSLQSFPPYIHENTKFYLPDTFSPSHDAYPKDLEAFQKFNLNIVNKNKALPRKFSFYDFKNFAKLLILRHIKFNSILRIIIHLIKESFHGKYRKRRSLMQAILSFDVYEKYLLKNKPEFTTYFTNHVAGMMHRYWDNLFHPKKSRESFFNRNSIIEAMDISDIHIGKLLKISESHNYDLLMMSSMGQDSIDLKDWVPELFVGNINKLIKVLNLEIDNYKLLPAMHPDLCIKCIDQQSKIELEKNINNIKSINGKSILPVRYKNKGLEVNISIQRCALTAKSKFIEIEGKRLSLESLGIEVINRDKPTGYHIKDGTLMFKGSKLEKIFKNRDKIINTTKIHNIILKFFDIKIR